MPIRLTPERMQEIEYLVPVAYNDLDALGGVFDAVEDHLEEHEWGRFIRAIQYIPNDVRHYYIESTFPALKKSGMLKTRRSWENWFSRTGRFLCGLPEDERREGYARAVLPTLFTRGDIRTKRHWERFLKRHEKIL